MAKGTGKSGQQVAEEHVQSLVDWLHRRAGSALPRYGAELNKSLIARECGFDRKVFRDNPRCAALIDDADRADRVRHLGGMDRAELAREERSKTDQERNALEARNLLLLAEIAALRRELERLRRLERLMAETGRLP